MLEVSAQSVAVAVQHILGLAVYRVAQVVAVEVLATPHLQLFL
jgi:hypothetical protein